MPSDFELVALDLWTGKELWRSRGLRLPGPGDILQAVRSSTEAHPGLDLVRLFEAEKNLVGADGTRFVFESGKTRHLVVERAGRTEMVKELEGYPHSLQVKGALVLYNFASAVHRWTGGGGEVFAYDYLRERMAWTLDLRKEARAIRRSSWTGIAIAGERVIVTVDQMVFARDLEGRRVWTSALPKQQIRRYDSAWTDVGLAGGLLIVRCYERLFALDFDTGLLHWSYDPGPFAPPDPLRDGDRLFIAVRGTAAPVLPLSRSR